MLLADSRGSSRSRFSFVLSALFFYSIFPKNSNIAQIDEPGYLTCTVYNPTMPDPDDGR